jgi:hypothetical protein
MSAPLPCAAPGCDNPVARRQGPVGRPPIYCSPACRPSRVRPAITVEVDQVQSDDERHGRDWVVRLRRGGRVAVVQRGLGRFSATALAAELCSVLRAGHVGEAS